MTVFLIVNGSSFIRAMKDAKVDLVLSDFRKERFDFKAGRKFWKLFARYQHEK